MPKYRSGQWDGWIHLFRYAKVPTGLFLASRAEIEKEFGIRFECEYRYDPVMFSGPVESDRLYQIECVRRMREAAQTGGGLVIAATGIGKTRIAGMLFKGLRGSAVFIVDELTLLCQTMGELQSVVGEPIGEIGDMEFRPQRITVATVQTLHRHCSDPAFQKWADGVQIMVIDELHLMINKRQHDVIRSFKTPAVFGLTATLELQKLHIRMQAYAIAGPVCFRYALKDGVEQGYLTAGVCTQLVVRNRIEKSDNWMRDYRSIVVRSERRNGIVADIARESIVAGRSVIILVQWVSHLELLSRMLLDIPHRVVYGAVDVEDRIRAKRRFDAGDLKLIIANVVFKKGIDIRRVDCIIDAAGFKSRNDAIQKFGRGVRLAEGKKSLVYFDIGDSGNRFAAATGSRRRALCSIGIPVKVIEWEDRINIPKLVRAAIMFSESNRRKRNGEEETDTGASAVQSRCVSVEEVPRSMAETAEEVAVLD